ncbi:MAG: response regulator, partial [Bacteroides sp.]
ATGEEIGFKSKVGEGSEFWYIRHTDIEFVEKSQSQEARNKSEAEEQHLNLLSTDIQSLKILIAEDNDSNFLLMNNILKKNNLVRATTGLDAVQKAIAQAFDVIFMDIKMPVMNGLEATSLIRTFDRTIPIIALTANAFDADKKAALAAGCDYFMTKPIDRRELIELLFKLRKE